MSYKSCFPISAQKRVTNTPKNVQRYAKKLKYERKMKKIAFFFKKIWSYQKKAVPLHPLSREKVCGM